WILFLGVGVVLPGPGFESQPADQALGAMVQARHIRHAKEQNPVRLENPSADLEVASGMMAVLEDVVEANRGKAARGRVRRVEIDLMQPAEVGIETEAIAQEFDAAFGNVGAGHMPAPVGGILKEWAVPAAHVEQRTGWARQQRLQLLDLAAILALAQLDHGPC